MSILVIGGTGTVGGQTVQNLLEKGEHEIKASEIGEMVMEELRKLDEVAYVRFASVYRQFRDINEFMSELKDLLLKKEE